MVNAQSYFKNNIVVYRETDRNLKNTMMSIFGHTTQLYTGVNIKFKSVDWYSLVAAHSIPESIDLLKFWKVLSAETCSDKFQWNAFCMYGITSSVILKNSLFGQVGDQHMLFFRVEMSLNILFLMTVPITTSAYVNLTWVNLDLHKISSPYTLFTHGAHAMHLKYVKHKLM